MRKNKISMLLLMQSLITILLLFVFNIELYITVGFFLIIGLIIGISLIFKKITEKELYVLISLFVSIIYLFLLLYNRSNFLIVMGTGQAFLFLISSLLLYEKTKHQLLPKPIKPASNNKFGLGYGVDSEKTSTSKGSVETIKEKIKIETYDLEDLKHDIEKIDKEEKRKKDEQYAGALAYELEREASELKRAENFINKKKAENVKLELIREAKALEDASKKISTVEKAIKEEELKREAELLQEAEKKIKDINFLNKQQELNRQATALVKAQKEINSFKEKYNKKNNKKSKNYGNFSRLKSVSKEENSVFATYNGNSFHEIGCMVIKKIPKKKLIFFSNQKEALKKGYKPCNVCKP